MCLSSLDFRKSLIIIYRFWRFAQREFKQNKVKVDSFSFFIARTVYMADQVTGGSTWLLHTCEKMISIRNRCRRVCQRRQPSAGIDARLFRRPCIRMRVRVFFDSFMSSFISLFRVVIVSGIVGL